MIVIFAMIVFIINIIIIIIIIISITIIIITNICPPGPLLDSNEGTWGGGGSPQGGLGLFAPYVHTYTHIQIYTHDLSPNPPHVTHMYAEPYLPYRHRVSEQNICAYICAHRVSYLLHMCIHVDT